MRANILELFLTLRESIQSFAIKNYVSSRLFSNLTFMKLRKFPSIPRLLYFIENRYYILANGFSVATEMIIGCLFLVG